MLYELSQITTSLAVERHNNIFGILCVCYGCIYGHVADVSDMKTFLAICPEKVTFSTLILGRHQM